MEIEKKNQNSDAIEKTVQCHEDNSVMGPGQMGIVNPIAYAYIYTHT